MALKRQYDPDPILPSRFGHDHHLRTMQEREEDEPQLIFCAVVGDGIQEVEVFLDEDMLDRLSRNDRSIWSGIIGFISSEIEHG